MKFITFVLLFIAIKGTHGALDCDFIKYRDENW